MLSSERCCLWPRACNQDGICWLQHNQRERDEYYARCREVIASRRKKRRRKKGVAGPGRKGVDPQGK